MLVGYDKPLNTKKNLLEYMELAHKEAKAGAELEVLEKTYVEINQAIDAMGDKVKINTVTFLKNELKKHLGKYEPEETRNKLNYFMEYFKEAYPEGKRRREYTYTMVDPSKITVDQILHTLKYINSICLTSRIAKEEKADIVEMIEKLAKTDSLKHINQVRSLEGLRKALRVKIVTTPTGHKVEKC